MTNRYKRYDPKLVDFPIDTPDNRIWTFGKINANPVRAEKAKALITGQLCIPVDMINLYHDHKVVNFNKTIGQPYLLYGFSIYEKFQERNEEDNKWEYTGFINYAQPCLSPEVWGLVKYGSTDAIYKRFTGFR